MKLYTVEQVAETLQLNPVTILRYIKAKKLAALRIGGGYRITERALNEFLKEAGGE